MGPIAGLDMYEMSSAQRDSIPGSSNLRKLLSSRKKVGHYELDIFGSGLEDVAGFCEHSIKSSTSVKGGNLLQ